MTNWTHFGSIPLSHYACRQSRTIAVLPDTIQETWCVLCGTIDFFLFLGPDRAKSYVGSWEEELKLTALWLVKATGESKDLGVQQTEHYFSALLLSACLLNFKGGFPSHQ